MFDHEALALQLGKRCVQGIVEIFLAADLPDLTLDVDAIGIITQMTDRNHHDFFKLGKLFHYIK